MNSTTLEAFSSELNTDRLINLCVSALNIDPTQEFLSILDGIGMSVFKAESRTLGLNDVNNIVVKEVSKYILDKRKDLLFKVISPKLYQQKILFSTENETILDEFKEITGIFLDSVETIYTSNSVVNSRNNTLSFKERLSPGKDLWSDTITVTVEPGNYSPEEYLEELEDLMTQASKVKNIYNLFYDKTTDKISIFTTLEKMEKDAMTRRKIRACEKAGDFLIVPEFSTNLITLGFFNVEEPCGNIVLGKNRFKYIKDPFFSVEVACKDSGKILFNFQVPQGSSCIFPLSLKLEGGVESVKNVILSVFPEDTEIIVAGRIEYILET